MGTLKSIYTDICNAVEERTRNYYTNFSEIPELPEATQNLNELDQSYQIDLPENYRKDYNICMDALADVIRVRNAAVASSTMMNIQQMPSLIANCSIDSEHRYILGTSLKMSKHSDYLAEYAYGRIGVRPGEIVYVETVSNGSIVRESAVVTQKTYKYRNDNYEYELYTVTRFSTSKFTYNRDSRVTNQASWVSGSVVTNNELFTVYVDTLNRWTTLDLTCWLDTTGEGEISFYKPSDANCSFPSSVDLWVNYYYPGTEKSGGSKRVRGSLTVDYDERAYILFTVNTDGWDVALDYVDGTVTGTWIGTNVSSSDIHMTF